MISNRDYNQPSTDRFQTRSRAPESSPAGGVPRHSAKSVTGCYNCKEKGHSFLHCTKPLVKCTRCNRVGHTAEKCSFKSDDKITNGTGTVQKTMRIDFLNGRDANVGNDPGSKFIKEVTIDSIGLKAFVDFGSDVTLIRESTARELGVAHDNVPTLMKGFGNSFVQSLGSLNLDMSVDGVEASVVCKVVKDNLLEMPVLLGQSFTEQSHISVYKDRSKLNFYNIGNELPGNEPSDDGDALLKFSSARDIDVYGVATVKVVTQTAFDGYVVLKNSVAGKPNEQYVIVGGLHRSVKGCINVFVMPCSTYCRISSKSVFCRAERVDIVNRVADESSS